MTVTRPPRLVLRILWTLLAVATVAVAAGAAVGLGGMGRKTERPHPVAESTTTVTRGNLVDRVRVDGKIAFGDASPVTSLASGTVTWLPAVGTVVSRGESMLRVDDQPVVLLYGTLPMFRKLATDVTGDDVKQFKQNLKDLGYRGFTVDTRFDAGTTTAVKQWQKKLKRTETGAVEVADVVYAAGPLRIGRQSVRIGAKAGAEVLWASNTTRVIQAKASAMNQRLAKVHNKVTVTLPDGKQVPGEVTAVGSAADSAPAAETAAAPGSAAEGSAARRAPTGGGSSEADPAGPAAETPLLITVADQAALGTLDEATVNIEFLAQTRDNVLTVPVHALLAIGEGGYGLEIRDGVNRRVVPVTVGLFSGGQVEVSAEGIVEGTTVGVAG
jgi:membrane fusion protein, multidrug efflux system